ncbi:putative reserved [Operophtera brumata]|uniref:Putative reserved n=1 Tax=Operophtera brumata TaxID=104452 RepID=A0A0L7LP51_OPEBR|nr:putative reserved [Operophtera brumata]
MSALTEEVVRNLASKSSVPLVLRDFVNSWSLCKWPMEKWCAVFGDREIPFRCMKKDFLSDEPCWERRCKSTNMTFKKFADTASSNEEWMYFDYKYLHQWFSADDEIYKAVSWEQFGFPGKGPTDTTLWVGSSGAHTPAHQDTYGAVSWEQFGFPGKGPTDTTLWVGSSGAHTPAHQDTYGVNIVVQLHGKGWWHYVQNLDPINISLNIWLPHDDISDTPLTVLFLQLDTVAKAFLDKRRKLRRAKRQRTREDAVTTPDEHYDLKSLLDDRTNNLETASPITSQDLVNIIKENIKEYSNVDRPLRDDEVDGSATLCLTKALIDSFSQSNVIDLVKQNLFARLS